ncbi:hypothetical protein DZB84_20935 [Bacillus sp. HNG]|uniref:hypothetical protein n=1 Tax=Bacillus sp. HNG TaxID=2293325 RepID=UPI000E2F3E7E|nr:hypothetical protein [Bacillus sp. HNG]RFB11399.1 hypothetical protein DZB84_20935 [Bacillus sp. HNG]
MRTKSKAGMTVNDSNPIKKKWLVVIAALIILSFTLQNFDFSQLGKLSIKDFIPFIILTGMIFLFKTSILSIILIGIQKGWKRLTKKD